MKKILIIIFAIGIIVFWFGEKRKFYDAGDGKYVTVWKTFGNVCYIIPNKYYGILKPSDGYLQTTITDGIVLFSTKKMGDTVVYNSPSSVTAVNSIKKGIFFLDLNTNKERINSIFYDSTAKKAVDVKQDVYYLHIQIKDDFAIDRKGESL